MIDFKPSQVFLNAIPPLMSTMGHAESEAAAALLVRACQVRGDTWSPVGPRELGEAIKADLDGKVEPWASLNRNPFFSPDFEELIAKGFARCVDGTLDTGAPIEFTPEGLERLRRWVR